MCTINTIEYAEKVAEIKSAKQSNLYAMACFGFPVSYDFMTDTFFNPSIQREETPHFDEISGDYFWPEVW